MSTAGLIMLGFGICFLSVALFLVLYVNVASEGWGLMVELAMVFLGVGGGIALMFYAEKKYFVMVVSILIGSSLAFYQFIRIFRLTKGMNSKQRKEFIIREQEESPYMMLLGCDSVEEATDGYHYIMTLAWQEQLASAYNDYRVGILTMVATERFLEPGKTYRFDERGMLNLGFDRYASLSEQGVDITGIEKSRFTEGDKLTDVLMNTVLEGRQKQQNDGVDFFIS